jgi:hypothetical protein
LGVIYQAILLGLMEYVCGNEMNFSPLFHYEVSAYETRRKFVYKIIYMDFDRIFDTQVGRLLVEARMTLDEVDMDKVDKFAALVCSAAKGLDASSISDGFSVIATIDVMFRDLIERLQQKVCESISYPRAFLPKAFEFFDREDLPQRVLVKF